MGLDMYLDKELFISEYDKNDSDKVDTIFELLGVSDKSGNYKHLSVTVPAIYWRKANAIHGWFVKNVQNGVDNCSSFYVGIEQLEQLLEAVTETLKAKTRIKNHHKKPILEPMGGFFFGSTDIDEWYWEDIKRTKGELKREIEFLKEQREKGRHWTFTYRASW